MITIDFINTNQGRHVMSTDKMFNKYWRLNPLRLRRIVCRSLYTRWLVSCLGRGMEYLPFKAQISIASVNLRSECSNCQIWELQARFLGTRTRQKIKGNGPSGPFA